MRNDTISGELKKCDFSDQYTVEIASAVSIRLNDECFVTPIYGDMRGFIKQSGELVMMEISTDEEHQNVYCDVSIDDFVAAPWGTFNDKTMVDPKLGKNAMKILREIKQRITIDDRLNGSFKRVGE
jgi:hypothetical protein